MVDFEVEGTTLLSWAIRVQAHTERDALQEAERIAGWIDFPPNLAAVRKPQHRIAGCRVIDPENESAG
jgi:hypothetical protein